ncbi:MAG: sulfatase/phosphatase domain-containing protein [Actinomycetota bacterium]
MRTPLVVRFPWASAGGVAVTAPVSAVDIASTILDLAADHATVGRVAVDGRSFRLWLEGAGVVDTARQGVLVEWAGDREVPAWSEVRTDGYAYIEHADGTAELYDVEGAFGPADPGELHDRAGDRRYAGVQDELDRLLDALTSALPRPPEARR